MKTAFAVLLALIVSAPSTPAFALEKLTVMLDWFVNPDHAPLIIAKSRGYFATEGLDIELISPADPAAPPRLVAAGQVDVAITYQPSLHMAVNEGLPLTRFGTLVASPLNTVIALADGPIRQVSDLKGKKVGYSVSGFEDAILAGMLEAAGLSAKDVEMINVNFALTAALVSGQVDAVVGGYRNFELTELDLAGQKGRAFFPEEHGIPAYDELIFVVGNDRAKDPRLPRFLAGVQRAVAELRSDPAGGWETLKRAEPSLDDELNRRAFADTLPLFATRPASLDKERYERFATFLNTRGLIKEPPPLARYAAEPR